MMKPLHLFIGLLGLVGWEGAWFRPAWSQEKVCYECHFDEGVGPWLAAHSVAPLTVREGHLRVAVTGPDPYIIHDSRDHGFNFPGHSRQYISLRARCTHDGIAEWFWANELEGRDSGFVAGQEVAFTVHGDEEWHIYNVFPDWQGRITGLRLDPPDLHDNTQVLEIDWIKVLELPPALNPGSEWTLTDSFQGFVPQRDVETFRFEPDGVVLTGFGQPTLQIADLALDPAPRPWFSLEATAPQPTTVRLEWRTEEQDYHPQNSVTVTVQPTPKPDFYNLFLGDQKGWDGSPTGLRLTWMREGSAAGADRPRACSLQVRSLALAARPRGPAALEWLDLKASATVAIIGQSVALHGRLRNRGGTAAEGIQISAEGPEGWEITIPQAVPARLAPGESAEVSMTLRSTTAERGTVTLVATSLEARAAQALDFIISRSLPPIPDHLATRHGERLPDGTVALAWGEGALLIPHNPYGYGPGFVLVRGSEGWRQVATLPALAEVLHDDAEEQALYPSEVALGTAPNGLPFAQFTARWTEVTGSEWHCFLFLAPRGPGRFHITSRLSCDRPAQLRRFAMPTLLVGDGTTGTAKREALFPGLEYLGPDEHSSSSRDIAPPHHLRFAPHPHRITVPVMAVEVRGEKGVDHTLVALLWDLQQEWAPGETRPTAVFAVPDFLEPREQHRLGLFIPSIPEYVPENQLAANTPFEMVPQQPVKLSAQILVRPQAEVLDAVMAWYALYGLPQPQPVPFSDEEMYALSLRGCEEILYTPGQGWAEVQGWAPGPSPATGLLYTLLEGELGDRSPVPDLRQKAFERSFTGYELPLALHIGGVEEALGRVYQRGLDALQSRQPDGRWVFQPNEKTAILGPAGETVVGIGAGPVNAILEGAAKAANERLLQEGLKGLKFLETFRIPRGAQVWECPLYAPDILASAQTARAFLWGYRLTGERPYLEQALYWAKTGLPFVYVWQSPQPGLEPMQGGSIPIFGATFFTGSWFGRLVQWNGLAYADVLLDLARYDSSFDWLRVAANLIASGRRQQRTEPEYRGLYPDSWSMIDGSISWGLMLGPQHLARLVLKQRGREPDGQLRLFRSGPHLVTLQAVGNLADVQVGEGSGGEVITDLGPAPFAASWTVQYDLGETSYSALVGVTRPLEVRVNGQDWPQVSDVERADRGWSYSASREAVILKLSHRRPTGKATVHLDGLDLPGE